MRHHTSVAVYVDGLYMPRNNALLFELDSIEQVEVLKGPQSTLYGRNATAGAITITTATPEPGDELSGSIRATAGNYDHRRVSGTISGGISDSFAASLTASYVERDGYVDNLTPGVRYFSGTAHAQDLDDDSSNLDERMVVGKLVWQPIESARLVLSASHHEADDQAKTDFALNNVGPGFANNRYDANKHWGTRVAENTSVSLNAEFDFENAYLVSITGWTRNDFVADTELVGAPVGVFGFGVDWDARRWSQEFRLHSDTDSALQWMIGAEYSEEDDDDMRINTLLGVGFGGPPCIAGCVIPSARTDWDAESYAVFGELTYSFDNDINLTLGLRQTEEEFSVRDLRPAPLPNESEDTSKFTYRLVVDKQYDWGLLYFSRSLGFVSGVFNVQSLGLPFVKPEELLSHEIGIKTELADGRVRLNAAFFNYEYEDIHAQQIDLLTSSTLLVAGQEATVRGVDLDIEAALSAQFGVNLGLSYLFEREYDEFTAPASSSGAANFGALNATGNNLAGAPELSASLSLDHSISIGDGQLETFLTVSHNSGYYFGILESVGTGGLDDDAYTLVNLRTTYYPAGDNWSIALWGSNLTDEYYFSGGYNATGINAAIGTGSPADIIEANEALPRTYGITIGYEF